MRQAGVIAAAGLHALQHHLADLEQDHCHAELLAECLVDNLATAQFVMPQIWCTSICRQIPTLP